MKNKLVALIVIASMFTSYFCGFGVMAMENMTNVALYQATTSSSFYSTEHSSSYANDGVNDNADYTYWMSASDDNNVWWQVDLGIPYEIDTIILEARVGAQESERKNIRIVAYGEDNSEIPTELVCISEEGYSDTLCAKISKKARYRYIRVEKTDSQVLSIGELSVLVKNEKIPHGTDFDKQSSQIPVENPSNRYKTPADVIGTPYEKAVSLLFALDIMHGYPNGSFLPYETISRAEFTALAVRLINASEETEETEETGFIDVPVKHWAYKQIGYAVHKEIVNGVGNGMFMPDDAVTLEQAIKIITTAMGYSKTARELGGYPDGYKRVAEQIGLLRGISDEANITRGEIALLICNALECVLADNDRSLLNEVFGIEHSSGVVTEAGNISIVFDSYIKTNGKIRIEDRIYITDIPDVEKYAGHKAQYYYETKNPEKVIALISDDADNIYNLNVSSVIKANDSLLTYINQSGEQITLNFDKDVKIIYDGKLADLSKINENLLPEAGNIKCIDNDSNNAINVCMVYPTEKYNGADYLNAFCGEMNKKAMELGMNNSHFNDPAGLKNFSTPADLAKCLMEAYRSEPIREIWSKNNYSFRVGGTDERDVSIAFGLVTKGNNAVSKEYDVLGGKGGNLNTPLIYNMAAIVSVPNSNDSISAVIMGSTSLEQMYDALKQTFDAAMIKYADRNADVSGIDVCSKSAIACINSDNAKDEAVVLFEKNPDLQDMTASTAKMLTAILVNQYVSDLDTKIYVTQEDIDLLPSGFYTKDYKAGDILTVRDALHALLYVSSNSSAFILGRFVGELILSEQ